MTQAESNKALVRPVLRRIDKGNFGALDDFTIHRIANGRLAEKWSGKDITRFLQQIGVMPRLPRPG